MARLSFPVLWASLGMVAALAFVPVMRLSAGPDRQGILLALAVCGTYVAGAALLLGEACRPHPLWLVWALPLVAAAGIGAALAAFLGHTPPGVRWPLAVLIPAIPVLALHFRIRTLRRTNRP